MTKLALFLAVVIAFVAITAGAACTRNENNSNRDTTPPLVGGLTVSEITDSSAIINWTTNEQSTGNLEYGPTASYGYSAPAPPDAVADTTSHRVVLSGLSPSTTYHYRVKSRDASANEGISADVTFATLAMPADTTAPFISGVASSNISQTSATITWSTSEQSTGNLEYGPTASYGYSAPAPPDAVADTTSHRVVLSGLTPDTVYHYRVTSRDSAGNEASSDDQTFTTAPLLAVHFIDAGQADAILIDFGHTEVLIDGGWRNADITEHLAEYVDGDLEAMVATHPHLDHIGGLIAVLSTFRVAEIWHNGDDNVSEDAQATYTDFVSAISTEGAQLHEARRGDEIHAGELTLTVLHPDSLTDDVNNNSIVLALRYGDVDFIFTGDAEQEAESSMVAAGIVPDVEVLKIGHHGSRTSSSAPLLSATSPEVAIYMAGKRNDYGYPHFETIVGLDDIGAAIYGTDIHGTVVVTTDGETYGVRTANDIAPVTPARVAIAGIDLQNEVVTITNSGASAVDMTGWRLLSVTGDQTYTFPNFTLAAGATVLIVSGPGAVDDPPGKLKWTGASVWNNGGDSGKLYNTCDHLVSSYP